MNSFENMNIGVNLEWDNLPNLFNWKDLLSNIEITLVENLPESEKNFIFQKIHKLVYTLVSHGDVYENIVIETAMLYLFAKYTKIEVDSFAEFYHKKIVEGVNVLISSTASNLETVFERTEIVYLGKIKLSEYLVEINDGEQLSRELIDEIDMVISKYQGKTHADLMNLLINARKNI